MLSARQHFFIGLATRLLLAITLPALLDDGLLLQGVRYTDIDYDVFTDAAQHVASGNSPYDRHTYRYTPFLAGLLALPNKYERHGILSIVLSTKYFGKILFGTADAICGYIIMLLRRRQRISQQTSSLRRAFGLSDDLVDALWWLYNPLPINICTRGSAESLVVLLPVLATLAVAEMQPEKQTIQSMKLHRHWPIIFRSCIAGMLHGIGIHAKLYPLIYTVSFMAYFSHQQQSADAIAIFKSNQTKPGWKHLLSDSMQYLENCICCGPSKSGRSTFPWKHPLRIVVLVMLWIERLFLTTSSMYVQLVSLLCLSVANKIPSNLHCCFLNQKMFSSVHFSYNRGFNLCCSSVLRTGSATRRVAISFSTRRPSAQLLNVLVLDLFISWKSSSISFVHISFIMGSHTNTSATFCSRLHQFRHCTI